MSEECIFCKVYKDRKGVVYENKYFYAQFDTSPVSAGHLEVIPTRHIASLFDLTEDEWAYLKPAISEAVRTIKKTDLKELYKDFLQDPANKKSTWFYEKMLDHTDIGKKPDAFNIGVNEGEAAGRTVHHLHIHIIPRYAGDVDDPVGGVRHIIPGMGNYKKIMEKR
jgi:diadenosine tetraphosphate (Ap4A) HIT family hydrolase